MSERYDLAIRGATLVTAEAEFAADLAVTDGRIAAIGQGLGQAREEVDGRGHYLLPGGVDPHAHIEQISGMGLMNADTFETATRSAAMGGTTTVISFAAQQKGQPLRDTVADYAARAARGAAIDHAFHLMVTDTGADGFEADLKALLRAGHRSVKVFTTYNIALPDADILQVLTLTREAGGLVCMHAENDAIIADAKARLLAAGRTRPSDHAASHPRMAEIEAVTRMIRFAEHTGAPVMIFHVSTAEAADAVRGARRRGIPVWAETCPHYLLMTEDVLEAPGLEGAKWMCSPPQRGAQDSAALWAALGRGDIDLVSSDHAPYRFDETGKLSAGPTPRFDQIANGMPGLEPRLSLLWTAMVAEGRGTAPAFVRATATNPAALYGLGQKGRLAPGADADLVLWDGNKRVTYSADDLHDNVGYNPWEGTTVTGWPEKVWLRGTLIKDGDRYLGSPGAGQWQMRPQDAGVWA